MLSIPVIHSRIPSWINHGNDLPDDAPWPWAMVRDDVTGLIWEMKIREHAYSDWYGAKIFYIPILNLIRFGGFSDWRLPTVKELTSIVSPPSLSWPNPIFNTDYFRNPNFEYSFESYWSSQSLADYPHFAWYFDYVNEFCSELYEKFIPLRVRAVRGPRSSNDFKDNSDGTVTDDATGLMWQQDTAPGLYNWEEALAYCESLALAGHDDWRLPKLKELQSIVDYTRYNPSIDPIFADTVSYYYWSSTTIPNPEYASNMSFYYGSSRWWQWKTERAYVRAVRGGQCGGN